MEVLESTGMNWKKRREITQVGKSGIRLCSTSYMQLEGIRGIGVDKPKRQALKPRKNASKTLTDAS
jgi:hypothetical protein